MSSQALILIDIQNDYFPGGALPLDQPEAASANAASLLSQFRGADLPVIHIQHETLQPEMGFLLKGSKGQELHSGTAPLSDEVVLTKHVPNSFWQTDLEARLNDLKVDTVVIAGMMTHMCVSTTARAAMERGFKVQVVADACATRELPYFDEVIPAATVHKTALAELGLFTELLNTNDLKTQ
ncbi:cysteine hydrolase family protein [Reinekea blandensis]|uniref:Isochorismatase n=1 Tax=Reinekea blandensis MED297 TaxID=314283 RepID=A4BCS5_9GAMM|nr:cysteine hydrolase family protein [Reinekea blandensis]EAR10007.1 Isochorismatase [Reinekea sp. MED297] [Reinekea blandensis MED297]